MNKMFTQKEFDEAVASLKTEKSPGPDKLTNEMLMHLGSKAASKLLAIYNNSWKTGAIPQSWRDAHMIPIQKQGKKTESYRPISLTSCCGKLMERMVNTRLMWHLESNNLLANEQAGFRKHHSTEGN